MTLTLADGVPVYIDDDIGDPTAFNPGTDDLTLVVEAAHGYDAVGLHRGVWCEIAGKPGQFVPLHSVYLTSTSQEKHTS